MTTNHVILDRLRKLDPAERKLLRFLVKDDAVVTRFTFLVGLREQLDKWVADPQDYPTPFSGKQWAKLVNTYISTRKYRELLREIGHDGTNYRRTGPACNRAPARRHERPARNGNDRE